MQDDDEEEAYGGVKARKTSACEVGEEETHSQMFDRLEKHLNSDSKLNHEPLNQ
jgi:hypothetical protein